MDFYLVICVDGIFILVTYTYHIWWIFISSFVLTGFLSLWFKLMSFYHRVGIFNLVIHSDGGFYSCDLNLSHMMDFYLVICVDGIFILVI